VRALHRLFFDDRWPLAGLEAEAWQARASGIAAQLFVTGTYFTSGKLNLLTSTKAKSLAWG
jgi:hypothetical protein